MQLFTILANLSLASSAFLSPTFGNYNVRGNLGKSNTAFSSANKDRRNIISSRSNLADSDLRSRLTMNGFSSFDGEYWFKRYDSVFSSPFSEYSHLIHILEGVLQTRSISTEDKAYLISLFNDSGLPIELHDYIMNHQNDLYNPAESHDYTSPAHPNSNNPKATNRYPEYPSERFRGDIPRDFRLLKDPRSILNRRSVKDFIEARNFSIRDLKYLNKIVREDYEFRSKVKRYFDEPIDSKLLSDEYFPYFMDILEYCYSYNSKEAFHRKISEIQVKTEESSVSFLNFFKDSKQKHQELKAHLEDENLSSSEKVGKLITALGFNYKNGNPLSPAKLLEILIETRKSNPLVIISPDLIEEFSQAISDLQQPMEVIAIASMLGIPTEFQINMISRFTNLDSEEKENYKWLGYQIANLDSNQLTWVFDEFLTLNCISERSISLKLDLISGELSDIKLREYWNLFEEKEDFEWFVKIIVDYTANLQKEDQENFSKRIIAYLATNKPEDSKRDLILAGLKSMKIDGPSTMIEEVITKIKEACNHHSPDKDKIMVMVNQLMVEMNHWTNREIFDYVFKNHGSSRSLKHEQNIGEWLQNLLDSQSIDIEGIALPINSNPVYPQMVPDKDSSSLVLTKTARRVLKNLAGQWRTGSVTLLEGPTSAGKTSYVKYISHLTNSPYMRINLSANTDVRDLIGRWVGGEERFSSEELEDFSDQQLATIAKNMGIKANNNFNRNTLTEQVLLTQSEAHWEDGPVVQAMRQGMVLLLDELNLAKPQVIEALNSLFDSGRLTLDDHGGEVVQLHPQTRIFATMNPSTYVGRNSMSEAFLSRCNKLWVEAPDTEDIVQIVDTLYPRIIPQMELAKLVSTHEALTELADQGHIGKTLGGIAFTLRNLFRVVERFKYFQGNTSLSDSQLLLREFQEVYLSTITDADEIKIINDILLLNMPVEKIDFYQDLEFSIESDGFTIGDMKVKRLNLPNSDLIPQLSDCEVVMTERTKKIFYKMVKALELGEHVALVGERASGKTILAEYYAALRGQPFYRQVFSAKSDNMELIGMYTPNGWQNGLLVRAGLEADKGNADSPGVFLADEFNQANDAVQERLNSLLDKDRTLFLSEKGGGEKIIFADDFRFIAAFNPPSYAGRRRLSKAIQSRLSVQFVPNLEDKDEYQLIFSHLATKLGISTGIVSRLVDLHFWVKEQVEAKQLGKQLIKNKYIFSIRQLKNALRSLNLLTAEQGDVVEGFKLAAELVYESAFESESDKELIREKVKELCK